MQLQCTSQFAASWEAFATMLCCSAKFAPQNARSLDIGGVAHAKIEKKKKHADTFQAHYDLAAKGRLEEST